MSAEPPAVAPSPVSRALHWTFDSRVTGKITVAQAPNVWVWIFIAALLVKLVAHPGGTFGRVVFIVEAASLTIWALDEIVRGVNPWRRFLGAAAIAYEIVFWLIL